MTRDEIFACAVIAGPPVIKRWPDGLPCPATKRGECSGYLESGLQCSIWICKGCKRRVPACFGCADQNPDLCDDCAVKGATDGPPETI